MLSLGWFVVASQLDTIKSSHSNMCSYVETVDKVLVSNTYIMG